MIKWWMDSDHSYERVEKSEEHGLKLWNGTVLMIWKKRKDNDIGIERSLIVVARSKKPTLDSTVKQDI